MVTCIHIVEKPNLRTLLSGKTETQCSLSRSPSCPPSQLLEHEAFLLLQLMYFFCVFVPRMAPEPYTECAEVSSGGEEEPSNSEEGVCPHGSVLAKTCIIPFRLHSSCCFQGVCQNTLRTGFLCCSFKPAVFFNVFGWCYC